MKKVLLIFALFILIVGGFLFTQNYFNNNGFFIFKKTPKAIINNQTFDLKVAQTQKEKYAGLSETKNLPQNQGMLFIFDKPDYYSFWMKGMKIPIDIIYIDEDEIVTILSNVQPPKDSLESSILYTSLKPADKVLEINAGLSEKYNFKNGDKITLQNL